MHTDTAETTPYYRLDPDTVLQAVESTGLLTDGHLLPLNSYENRVYQVGMEDQAPLVAKFYRPGRWSDAQILEEHAFALELAEAEIPLVPPLALEGATLHDFEGFRFALFERRGGHAPQKVYAAYQAAVAHSGRQLCGGDADLIGAKRRT